MLAGSLLALFWALIFLVGALCGSAFIWGMGR